MRALALLLSISTACSYTHTHVAGRSPSRALWWGDVAASAGSLVAVGPWAMRDDSTAVRLSGLAVLLGSFALFGLSAKSVLPKPAPTTPKDCIAQWDAIHLGDHPRLAGETPAEHRRRVSLVQRPLACDMGDD